MTKEVGEIRWNLYGPLTKNIILYGYLSLKLDYIRRDTISSVRFGHRVISSDDYFNMCSDLKGDFNRFFSSAINEYENSVFNNPASHSDFAGAYIRGEESGEEFRERVNYFFRMYERYALSIANLFAMLYLLLGKEPNRSTYLTLYPKRISRHAYVALYQDSPAALDAIADSFIPARARP